MSPSAMPDAEDMRTHEVYRIYDAAGQLLYIGCSMDAEGRIRTWHMNPRCAPMSVQLQGRIHHRTIERYPNKAEARQAEREAITAEAPLLNKQHNPKRWSKRDAKPVEPVTLEEMREALTALADCIRPEGYENLPRPDPSP
jgi:hypothetical protein